MNVGQYPKLWKRDYNQSKCTFTEECSEYFGQITFQMRKYWLRWELQFLGHVLRKEELEDVAITGKIEGKRARGRQRLTFISSLSHLMKIGKQQIIRTAKDRELWRTVAANVLEEQGT